MKYHVDLRHDHKVTVFAEVYRGKKRSRVGASSLRTTDTRADVLATLSEVRKEVGKPTDSK